jgi:predicted branched-subunit amino acid permease
VSEPAATAPVRRQAWVIAAAVGAYGLSFGASAVAAGLSLGQASTLSLFAFTGASQFALVGVLGAGGSVFAGLAAAWLLGARNLVYVVRLAPVLPRSSLRRLIAVQGVIDETTAMATARDGSPGAARRAFLETAVAVYITWNLTTVVGALLASAVPDPRAFGLDAAFPAAFLALLAPRFTGRLPWLCAGLGAAIAIALVPAAPAGVPVLAAVLGVLPAAVADRRGHP